jgi:hypothetical protein
MTIKHEPRWCPRCGAQVYVAVRRPNHVLHAVMSLLTFGLWLPIWALAGIESLFHRGRVKCPPSCAGRRG